MNVHKVVLMVIDFDDIGAESVKSVIESARYPNRCISPRVMKLDTQDIGEWQDDHPLNHRDEEEFDRLFGG